MPPVETSQPPAETPNSTPVALETGSETVFTQTQLNAIVAAARREERAKASRAVTPMQESPTAPAQAQAQSGTTDVVAQLQQRIDNMEMRGRFDKALLGQSVSEAQADVLFDLYRSKADRPADTRDWLTSTMGVLGIGKQTTPQTTVVPKAAPADSIPRAVDLATAGNNIINMNSLTSEQSRDPKLVREIIEHNARVKNRTLGAPPPPRRPGQK
jgi:hypothetical protein